GCVAKSPNGQGAQSGAPGKDVGPTRPGACPDDPRPGALPEKTALIKARGVSRQIAPDRWLFRGACLEVRPGDRLAITGPTGSGKTVLLRAIALLDPLDEGLIHYQGSPVAGESIPAYRKKVIYLHQRPALFKGSVADNLQRPFALQIHQGKHFDRQRILRLLAIL